MALWGGPTFQVKYLKALHRAGLLRQVRPKLNGRRTGGHAVWRLIDVPGPRAPIVRRDGTGVYDPNRDRFIPWVADEPADEPVAAAQPDPKPAPEELPDAYRHLA